MITVLAAGLAAALLIRRFPGLLGFLFEHGIRMLELAAGVAIAWWIAADVLPYMH
jgi:hypothetical protein